MTKPRSSPALRSDKVQIFRDEGENVRSTNTADSADCRKTAGSKSGPSRCFQGRWMWQEKKWIAKLLNLSEAASLFTKRTKGNSNNCSGFIHFWDILCQFTIKDSSVLRHNFWKWERYHGYTEMIENSSTQIYFAVMQAIISRKVRLLFKCQISHFGMKPAWFANGW